jgi:Ca2+/Na+ antiporter
MGEQSARQKAAEFAIGAIIAAAVCSFLIWLFLESYDWMLVQIVLKHHRTLIYTGLIGALLVIYAFGYGAFRRWRWAGIGSFAILAIFTAVWLWLIFTTKFVIY